MQVGSSVGTTTHLSDSVHSSLSAQQRKSNTETSPADGQGDVDHAARTKPRWRRAEGKLFQCIQAAPQAAKIVTVAANGSTFHYYSNGSSGFRPLV